ncbi:GT-D fold domain-containing glycosyltransferase [Cytophagales bacterium LB-30]|uniref:GT-D fold domain-containing glycosyltransferase n=1 Tax=Shiella aurantiaca TaxID=3058365 RepID=A0ABT8F802_9BACT|nr:GT-D fold domain-containing glycosyltransferase [Shiella aurantiaca]MDN4166618.1 GT-D fold domain-containing glycosyltransferase [Shiella aurantiaca]
MKRIALVRYGSVFRYPRKAAKYFFSSIYPLIIRIFPLPKVLSIEDTLDEIINNKKSIARFGDGEFLYILDKLNLPFQKYDIVLANYLKELLLSDDEMLLIGLPSGYHGLNGLNREGKVFWRSQISWIYPRLKKYLNLKKQYANASITRLYIEIQDKKRSKILFDKVKLIWEGRDVVLVEGEKSRLGVGNDLFDRAKSIVRILAPAKNAFSICDSIVEQVLVFPKEVLVLIALGPTAKVVVQKIHSFGYQAVDIGNVDIEYEWFKMNATEKVKINGKYTSEAIGGREVADINDQKYNEQIRVNLANGEEI